jgi:uncharacterized protein YjgD (DUF1641 family)
MEELTKKELLDYLEEISQQLNNIALDQIPFAISELYFKLENSIPISLIEKEIEEYEEIGMIGVADCMKRLLDKRSNTDER